MPATGKLKFDQEGKRFYENGVDHGILFVQKSDGTYDKGVAWNGLTSVSQSPEGAEAEDVYADNMKYLTLISAETFGATINAYTYPDEFNACDGNVVKGGVVLGQQKRTKFAFAYRTSVGNDQGIDAHKLHIVYGCTASPSEREYSTVNDSPEAMEMSWEIKTTPVVPTVKLGDVTVKPISHIEIDEIDQKTGSKNDAYAYFENILLGTDADSTTDPATAAVDSALPTVDEVITYMNSLS